MLFLVKALIYVVKSFNNRRCNHRKRDEKLPVEFCFSRKDHSQNCDALVNYELFCIIFI